MNTLSWVFDWKNSVDVLDRESPGKLGQCIFESSTDKCFIYANDRWTELLRSTNGAGVTYVDCVPDPFVSEDRFMLEVG